MLESFGVDGGKPLKIAVIGASGGIGGAFVEKLAGHEQLETLYALSRKPDFESKPKIKQLPIDLTDETSIENAAAKIFAFGDELDLIIVATGILHDEAAGIDPEKDWKHMNGGMMAKVFAINTIGPALIIKYFAPLLTSQRRSMIALLSARVGSISDNHLGGWYAYRSSKSALNQIIRTASIELARKKRQAIIIGLHPGTVETGLSDPFRNASHERFAPLTSAEYLLTVINHANMEQSGRVLDWSGKIVPE